MLKPTTALTCETLLAELPEFFQSGIGNLKIQITNVASPHEATMGSIAFCATPKALAEGLTSSASVLVIGNKAAPDAETKRGSKTLLIAGNVERAMATTINRWFLGTPFTDRTVSGVHPTATIHASAKLGQGIRVGPNAVVSENVTIGDGVYIGANSVVEANARIGKGSVLHPLTYIGHGTILGERCEVMPNSTVGKEGFGYAHDEKNNHYRIPHQGRVVLEDDVHIGSNTALDRGTFGETRICAGTKIDNQVHIAHNCKIGRNSLLTAGFAIAGSSTIGNNFVAGGNTTVTGHITVADQVQVAGLSAISGNVPESGQYGGYPLQPLKVYLKNRVTMGHLAEMKKQISKLTRAVFPNATEDKIED